MYLKESCTIKGSRLLSRLLHVKSSNHKSQFSLCIQIHFEKISSFFFVTSADKPIKMSKTLLSLFLHRSFKYFGIRSRKDLIRMSMFMHVYLFVVEL